MRTIFDKIDNARCWDFSLNEECSSFFHSNWNQLKYIYLVEGSATGRFSPSIHPPIHSSIVIWMFIFVLDWDQFENESFAWEHFVLFENSLSLPWNTVCVCVCEFGNIMPIVLFVNALTFDFVHQKFTCVNKLKSGFHFFLFYFSFDSLIAWVHK